MKYFLALLLIPQLSLAALSGCGEYEVRAVVRANKTGHEIVVNEKTKSELNISMPIADRLKLAPYMDMPVTANLLLTKTFDGTNGYAESMISIKKRLPDPLNPEDTGLKLIKRIDCKKD